MESGRTTVSRAAAHITYPTRFQLVAAMNPCRCGYLGLEQAMEKLRLSPRGYTRTMRVGRTIADMAGAEVVGRVHVAEALAFRHRTKGR